MMGWQACTACTNTWGKAVLAQQHSCWKGGFRPVSSASFVNLYKDVKSAAESWTEQALQI
jgi:hypothetical protein